jgi:hypothetical protein
MRKKKTIHNGYLFLCNIYQWSHSLSVSLNTTITAIRFISNPNHPIRPYCLNPTKPAAPKFLFVQAIEYLGKLQIDTRKIERLPQSFRPPWTNIDHNRFDYELYAIQRDFKLKLFAFSTKSTNITAKYTQTDRKKTKWSDTQ